MFSLHSASSYWKTSNTQHNLLARRTAQLANFAYWTCISVHVNTHHPKVIIYSLKLLTQFIEVILPQKLYSTLREISQKTHSVLDRTKDILMNIFFLPSTLFSFCSPNTAWNRMRSIDIFSYLNQASQESLLRGWLLLNHPLSMQEPNKPV